MKTFLSEIYGWFKIAVAIGCVIGVSYWISTLINGHIDEINQKKQVEVRIDLRGYMKNGENGDRRYLTEEDAKQLMTLFYSFKENPSYERFNDF